MTLSADDIINMHLNAKESPFELILLAEEDEKSDDHQAKVLTGSQATKRLKKLMEDV